MVLLAAALSLGAPTGARAEGEAGGKTNGAASGELAKPVPTEQVKSRPDSRFGVVEVGPFTETTTVRGKLDADLNGVWLLVASVEIVPGKFRNLPQLFKVTNSAEGPQFHLLDVKLPEELNKSLQAAKADRWQPSPELRKSLSAQWKQLAPYKEKTINEVLYDRVKYELLAPDHYSELGTQGDPKSDKALGDTKFSMRITESYKPREIPKDVPIGQLAQRVSIYGVKQTEKDVLQGEQLTGFVAVGIASPLPFTFNGPFVMYRLASG